jgi:PAS domain S-box-containing protein
MEPIDRAQDLAALRHRNRAITEAWYQAVGSTSYVPFPADEVRARLSEWVDELISLLYSEPLNVERAEQVGAALAGLHFVQAEALGGTVEVLGRELCGDLVKDQDAETLARLATLLGAISIGFCRQMTGTILDEQEQTRTALVTELRATEHQLRQARDELEVRVEKRTAELARANEGLLAQIAERQRAEQALQESEERWRSLVENAPDIVIAVDRTGRILLLNRVPETAGDTVEQLVGTDVFSYVHTDHHRAVREALEAAFGGQRGAYLEVKILSSYGRTVWYAVRLGPVWRQGEVTSVMAVVRDISEEKQVQELKDNLIRDVSHELRSPLAKVRMSLDVLAEVIEAERPDRERAQRIGQLARRNVDRLLQTVEGMLDLTRLESDAWAGDRQVIQFEDLLEEVIQQMIPIARSKDLELRVEMPEVPLPLVEGDRERLCRVLLNLLDNAIKFTAEGHVVVWASGHDEVLEVAVADTGEGMEAAVLERVFDRYYQARSRSEGVGIGLTICKAVVEAHGGRIWAESPGRGEGATFRFTLPVEPAEASA